MKITLKVGTGWFETNFNDSDVFEIVQETKVNVEYLGGNKFWYRTIGKVDGFPINHPPLLIYYKDVEIENG